MVQDLGVITAERLLADNMLQTQVAAEVIMKSAGTANLNRPEIIRTIDTKGDLTTRIPGVDSVEVHQGVQEGQKVGITDAKCFSIPVDLVKDSAVISLTDEAVIRSSANGFSAWDYLQEQAERKLAALQDERIVDQLNTTPQTGTSINLKSGNIYDALAEAETMFGDYNITAIVCSREARTHIFRNTNASAYTGSNPAAPYNMAQLPGTGIPIIDSTAINRAGLNNSLFFVSSEVPSAVWASGQVATNAWRDNEADKILMRIDAYRGCKSNIIQTDTNLNQGVVKTAWTFT